MPEVWPFAPAPPVREFLEFTTDVRRALTGEMRDSLHDAIQSLQLSHAFQPGRRRWAQEVFEANIDGEWYVPLWQDGTLLEAGSVAAGAGTLSVETDADYRAGGKAILWKSATSWELVDVASVGSGSLTLSGTVASTYAAPVWIAPVGRFVAPGGLRVSRTFALEAADVTFRRLDNADLGANPHGTYASAPLLPSGSVVVSPLAAGVEKALDVIESGFGALALAAEENFARERSQVAWADATRAARWSTRQFLHYCRGRDRPFWLPTFRQDFQLAAIISPGGSVASVEALDAPPARFVGKVLWFRNEAASLDFVRTVTAVSDAGATWNVTLNSAVPASVPVATKLRLMVLARLDTDSLEIVHEWRGGDDFVSRVAASTLEVPA